VKISKQAVVAAATVGVLALSACGGSKGSGGGGGNTSASGYNAAVTKVLNASDKKGGTLNLWSSQDADSLDPAIGYYAFVWNLERFYTRTLVTYPSAPGAAGLKLTPDMAQSMPTISADGKTYTFKLRSGMKFQDGTPITSKDIKYGIERDWAPELAGGPSFYLQNLLDEGQKYPGPYKDTDPNKLGLKSIETPDDSTIVFHLPEASSDFMYYLAMGTAAPVEKSKDTGTAYAKSPVSSGPYEIAQYTPGKIISFVRNPNWDQSTDPIRKALPDKINVNIDSNADDLDSRLLAGTADLDAGQTGVQTAAQDKVLLDPKLKANTDDAPNGFIRYVSMQTKVAPFDNIHCRKAVEYAAVEKDLQTARGGSVAGKIATNMLPPNILGSDNYDPYNLAQGQAQDDKAKQELAACGKPNGFTTTVAVRNNKPKEIKTAQALQQALAKVGITVNLHEYDGANYNSVIGSPSSVHAGGYGLIVFGWGADYPTAPGFLGQLVNGNNIPASGNNNYPELNDPKVNALITDAAASTDPNKVAQDYQQINHEVMDQAVYLPIVYDQALNYRNPRLTNVVFEQAYGMIDFQSLGVSDGK
jgi:peptide/nickel transport system substrate-binding protein